MSTDVRAELYLSFAAVFHRPHPDVADNLEEMVVLWTEEIAAPPSQMSELTEFCRRYPAGQARLNAMWEHYIPLFETGQVEAPPYAAVYQDLAGLVMGEETLAVQRFYEVAGYKLDQDTHLPDHLAVELEFMALLARDGDEDLLAEFRQRHLLPFLSAILPRIKEARRPFYSGIAELLERWQFENQKKEGDLVG